MTLTYLLEGINDINIPLWQRKSWTSWTSWTSCIHFYFAFYRPYASTDLFHLTFIWIPTLSFIFIITQTLNGNRFCAVKQLSSRCYSHHFDVLLWLLWQWRNNNTSSFKLLAEFSEYYDSFSAFPYALSFLTCIFKWCASCFGHINDGQWRRSGWFFYVETFMMLLKTSPIHHELAFRPIYCDVIAMSSLWRHIYSL